MVIVGNVDEITPPYLRGWARNVTTPSKAVVLEIVADGQVIATVTANKARSDLLELGYGNCAFELTLPTNNLPEKIDKLCVRPSGDEVALNGGVYHRNPDPALRWQSAWTKPEALADLNRWIHDGVPEERLYDRAADYHRIFFDVLYPSLGPAGKEAVLDVGSGVGWPMQALLDRLPDVEVTGLDISEVMIARARQRFAALENGAAYLARAHFTLYDGVTFPFTDESFDYIYAYAALWHIPELQVFRIMREMFRVLRHGGRCFVQFMTLDALAHDFERQYSIQVGGTESGHFHFYHSVEKLALIAARVCGARGIDVKKKNNLYWTTFGKTSEPEFLREDLAAALRAVRSAIDFP